MAIEEVGIWRAPVTDAARRHIRSLLDEMPAFRPEPPIRKEIPERYLYRNSAKEQFRNFCTVYRSANPNPSNVELMEAFLTEQLKAKKVIIRERKIFFFPRNTGIKEPEEIICPHWMKVFLWD